LKSKKQKAKSKKQKAKSKKQKAKSKKKRKEWLVVLNPHLENFNIGFYSLWFICF
jgi:hypothetical protein